MDKAVVVGFGRDDAGALSTAGRAAVGAASITVAISSSTPNGWRRGASLVGTINELVTSPDGDAA
ncbi:MAG: hypothetical protein ABWX92_05080, partial [Mycetocola sp.]